MRLSSRSPEGKDGPGSQKPALGGSIAFLLKDGVLTQFRRKRRSVAGVRKWQSFTSMGRSALRGHGTQIGLDRYTVHEPATVLRFSDGPRCPQHVGRHCASAPARACIVAPARWRGDEVYSFSVRMSPPLEGHSPASCARAAWFARPWGAVPGPLSGTAPRLVVRVVAVGIRRVPGAGLGGDGLQYWEGSVT